MEKGYKILGNYIRLVDERNKDLSVTKLLGVSISKKFIPSIRNCALHPMPPDRLRKWW